MNGVEEVNGLVPEFTEWLSRQEIPKGAEYVAAGDSASALGRKIKIYADKHGIQIPSIRPLNHDTTWELYFANELSGSILESSVVGASIYFLDDFAETGEKVWNFYNCMSHNLGLSVVFTIMIAKPSIRALPTNARVWKYDQQLAQLLKIKYDRRRS